MRAQRSVVEYWGFFFESKKKRSLLLTVDSLESGKIPGGSSHDL